MMIFGLFSHFLGVFLSMSPWPTFGLKKMLRPPLKDHETIYTPPKTDETGDQKFSMTIILVRQTFRCSRIFTDQRIFQTKNFHWSKIFADQKFSVTKIFGDKNFYYKFSVNQNIFLTNIFFWSKILFYQIFCWPKTILT